MPLRDDILNPISEAAPSGPSLRYERIYDQLKSMRSEELLQEQEEQIAGTNRHGGRRTSGWEKFRDLASTTIATKTKDLQIGVWLAEALLRCDGFPGLKDGLDLLKALQEQFWDTVYPEIEDDDLELRAAPLDWVGGAYLDRIVKAQLIVKSPPYSFLDYTESRAVGTEEAAQESNEKVAARQARVDQGWVTPEDFDQAVKNGGTAWFQDLVNMLDACLASLESLDEFSSEKFGDVAPSFLKLRESLTEVRHRVGVFLSEKQPKAEKAEPEEEAEQATEEAAEEETTTEEAEERVVVKRKAKKRSVTGIEPNDKEDAEDRLGAIAQWMRAQDTGNPAPYLLLRGYRWGELRAGGGSLDTSLLEAPPTETRTEIKRLANEGAWDQVIEAGEAAMATAAGRGWLDLQRYIVKAADESGLSNVASGIKAELKALLTDLPDLQDAVLMDDTPTANRETQEWIKEQILPPKEEPEPVQPYYPAPHLDDEQMHRNGDGETTERPPDAFDLAMEAAKNGSKAQAIEILTRELAQERSGRGRFQRRLQLAQVCLSIGQEMIARPILEELAGEVEKRRLEEWESGDMVAHPLAMLFRCLNSEDAEKRQKLYAMICRLDPVQALGMK